jgi:hypothetical protein
MHYPVADLVVLDTLGKLDARGSRAHWLLPLLSAVLLRAATDTQRRPRR